MTTNQKIDGVPRELLKRLVRIEAIERDDPNGSGYDLCPECFGQGKWNWSAGKRVSVDPIEHSEGCAIEELRALLDAPAENVIDVSVVSWNEIQQAASESTWMPSEYMRNDWVDDVCRFLREGPAAQPQGVPVAYADPKAFENFGTLAHLGGLYAREWMWANPAPGLVPLYAEQPAPVAPETGEPYAYEYEFATVLYTTGPGKFKKVITSEAPDPHEIDAGSIINVKPLYDLERRKYDDTLLPFLALMRKELHANSHKGDRDGWLGMTSNQALSEVLHHVKKLEKAEGVPQATEYAADVANCCMMLLDVCGVLGRA